LNSTIPKRLIEVDLPIKRISEIARPEKTTVHGNISTLHIWWARRPHAACRAVLCASLWFDPADPICPQGFAQEAADLLISFSRQIVTDKALAAGCSPEFWEAWQSLSKFERLDCTRESDALILRSTLLNFIADFSKWENQNAEQYLRVARELTKSAHAALSPVEGERPFVFDPFAGGGTIPIEAIRIGADAFASDLNPIAVLLNKVILEYMPKQPDQLRSAVDHWAIWIKERVAEKLKGLFPQDSDLGVPLVYLWGRTVLCEGPSCGYRVPLIRTLDLGGGQALKLIPQRRTKTFEMIVQEVSGRLGTATVKAGKVTCPVCDYTTPAKSVKKQLSSRNGGSKDAQLLAVLSERNGKRRFRAPSSSDLEAISLSASIDESRLPDVRINPIRPHKNTRGLSAVTRIGMARFKDLYTHRQLCVIKGFSTALKEAIQENGGNALGIKALTILGLCFGRLLQQNSTCARWRNGAFAVAGSFGKQALQIVWDFAEIAPLSKAAGSWDGAVEWVRKIIELNKDVFGEASATQAPAQNCPLPTDSASMLFTDPPYFAAIPYSDLANFFYVWEREIFEGLYPELFSAPEIDQTLEAIVTNANKGPNGCIKDEHFFREQMTASLRRAREIVKPNGIGVVVFADTRTASWEALLGAIIESGWYLTASWPIDTEHQNRTQARGAASLQSSIHLVCRPREDDVTGEVSVAIGDWRDVLSELPKRMRDWMPRLAREGIVGADAIFACLGPALEVFSKFAKVEKANGDVVQLKEYLTYVWAAVAQEALQMVFAGADTSGFEEDARLTAIWLWTLFAGTDGSSQSDEEESEDDEESEGGDASQKGYELEYDAARKIAQGLGANLEALTSVVEIKGESVRLLPVAERTKKLFGKDDADSPNKSRKKKSPQLQLGFVDELEQVEQSGTWGNKGAPALGATVLDRVHQCMILFAAGRGEALKRFLVEEGVGREDRFWRLAQVLSFLYPKTSDEKRWIDGLLARKKGLGF
jgi:adenine-specific DNA methylase